MRSRKLESSDMAEPSERRATHPASYLRLRQPSTQFLTDCLLIIVKEFFRTRVRSRLESWRVLWRGQYSSAKERRCPVFIGVECLSKRSRQTIAKEISQ